MDAPAPPKLLGFGGVAAVGPDGPVELGGPKQQAVLGLLLLEPGTVVPLDRIIDRIWGEGPPPKAAVSVRGYVSNLRKALGATGIGTGSIIEFRDRGYVLRVPADSIDLHRFEADVREGVRLQRLGDLAAARVLLERALALHVGPPLGSVAEALRLADETARFEERRGEAVDALTDVRLALGEHAQLPAALATEIARQPYRERLRAQLALALYRAGRPVEALRALSDTRRMLRDDIGVEPGPELRRLEAAILAHDEPALAWAPATPAPPPADRDLPDAVPAEERLFGRATEENEVRRLVDRLHHRGGVLVVSGEPGIGKSAVLRGVRAEAHRRGVVVGWDACPESAAAAPYRSWRSAVAPLLPGGGPGLDAPGADVEAASTLLAHHLQELERLRTRTEPAVVVIDDLQWADDATLSLLAFLAPELERLRLLLAVGVRRSGPNDVAPAVRDCLAELGRTSDPLLLGLAGLGPDDIARWAGTVIGAPPASGLVDHLADTTGGNPFYLRELLALLVSEGRLDVSSDAAPAAIPLVVQDVVRRRTSRLPPDTQALLTVAAVIGRRFDLDVLAGVLRSSVADVLGRLEPALDEGLVESDDRSPARFAFSHALVSSTLVAELNPARLATHHARITEVLEQSRAADLAPWVEELAHHASAGMLAGTAAKALDYAVLAAEASEEAQAHADVALQLERALAAAALLPDVPVERRRDLLLRRGRALRETGDATARSVLIEAARLAEVQGDVHAFASILGDLDRESLWAGYDWTLSDPSVVATVERALTSDGLDARERAVLTGALAAELTYLDNDRSKELFGTAWGMVEPLEDPVLSARLLLQWFWSVSGPSGVEDRARIGDALVSIDVDGALPSRLRPLARLARVSSALEVGDGDLARSCVATARALAHPVRTPTAWAHLQFAEAGLALLDDDLERARAHAHALRPALQRVRRYTADSSPASILAVVAAEAGETDAALEHLAGISASPYGAPIGWLEAWILAEGGRPEGVRPALGRFDGPLPDDWLMLALTTAAVHAAAAVGDARFLRRHLPSLEPLADRFAFVGEGGPCLGPVALALGVAHAALGDHVAARRHAEQAGAICERMGAVRWSQRTRQLLDSLSAG